MHLHDELQQRGFLKDISNPDFFDLFDAGNQTFYFGVDPTADSMHVGHFVQFMHAVQYMKKGNHLVMIVGGATGMIGDPGGKDSERQFLDTETLHNNVTAITRQVQGILENLTQLSGHSFSFEVINNLDFYTNLSYLDFLREVGKYITVNQMMNKETVKKRIEDPDKSISYTEFSYMLMQAYDFYRLFTEKNCILQIAGSDQRGNVVTGIELIRKKLDQEAYGVTCQLIVDSNGKKFGKSEGNALRLDTNKTSAFHLYQYFINATDDDVEKYLKLFTLLSFEEIDHIVTLHRQDTAKRVGQQELAYYVTATIAGKEQADTARLITQMLFGGTNPIDVLTRMHPNQFTALYQATDGSLLQTPSMRLVDALEQSGMTTSIGEAKKAIKEGSIFLNEQKIDDINYVLTPDDFLQGIVALLRKGKKTYKTLMLQAA